MTTEEKKYFTAVFEWSEAFTTHFPFEWEGPWGRAVGIAVGDIMHTNDLLEEALNEIAEEPCTSCSEIAASALEAQTAYIHSQLGIGKEKPVAETPNPDPQLDLIEAIKAKAS